MGDKATVDVGIFWDTTNSLFPYETVSGSSGTHTFTLTEDIQKKIYAKLTDTAEATVYYYVRTTLEDGTRYYNNVSKKVSILNPDPTFSVATKVDNTTMALTKSNKRWIKGYTDILYGYQNIDWVKGATYKSCMAMSGGRKVYGNFGIEDDGTPAGVFEKVEDNFIGFYITNSRSCSAAVGVEADALIEYIDLTCNITNTKMEIITGADGNSTLRATITIEGNLFTGSFNGKDDNSVLLTCGYKADGAQEFTEQTVLEEITIDKTKNRYSVTTTITGLDYQKEYTFRASAMDLFNAAHINFVYSKEVKDMGKPIFDWSKEDFNFNIPMYYKNQKLIYEAGDSITIPERMCFSGFISNGIKALLFTIPIAKPIFASGAKIDGSVICRGVSGYINGTSIDDSAIDISTNDSGAHTNTELSSVIPTVTENAITIRIDFPSTITGLTMEKDNNTPITVVPRGTLTITLT